jgi:hypothetical protein
MNKLIAIFLLLVFMCANTSIGQLFKIPNLIKHYNEHKSESTDASISFIDFIKLHYSNNAEHSHEEHQDLPYKSLENSSTIIYFTFSENNPFETVSFFNLKKKIFCYHSTFKSNLITSIWLPPKIA